MTTLSGTALSEATEALRARLKAYVAHESESSRRALQESWALTVAERVDAGSSVAGLRLVGQDGNGTCVFDCDDFSAKFREGDPLYLGTGADGTGADVESGWPVNFAGYDVASGRLRVAPDRFEASDPIELDENASYCLDRRGLGLDRLLLEGLDSVFHPENARCIAALLGEVDLELDEARYGAGRARGGECGFTEAQCEGLGRIIGTDGLCLVQGPPGTGKTRLLAEAALMLAKKRCKLFVTGFTHRAVNNVLLALRALEPRVPIVKVGGSQHNDGLAQAKIDCVRSFDRVVMPSGGVVVGGTPFAVRKFVPKRRFHWVLMDEAGQMPVVHGAIAMTQAKRFVIVGDPRQLPPVREGRRDDAVLGASLYEFLERHRPGLLLDRTFRMNASLTAFPSAEFYGGHLQPAAAVADRRLRVQATGDLAEVVDPEKPLVLARVDHEGRTRRSPEEVAVVADLIEWLRREGGLRSSSIAVIAPFRAQVRLLRYELERRGLFDRELVVDTVERMQGQEREVVILSLVASDRDYLEAQAGFFYEPGRLNVALTRARTKCIVVGSRHAFRARPMDLEDLMAVAHFKRLARTAPVVDLTAPYGGVSSAVDGSRTERAAGSGE